jgi:diguanylate cyclase (GGDEF)-like protein
MIRPFYVNAILSVLAVLVTIFVGVIGIIGSSDRFNQTADFIFRWEFGYALLVAVIFVVPVGILGYVLNSRLYSSQEENHVLKQENKNLELRLQEEHTKNRFDIVTKIPNRSVWEEDIPNYCLMTSPARPHQLIMLDLVDFAKVNQAYGHFVGDEVLETIAQDLYGTVRRYESVYKDSAKDVYRSYERGDEFLFIVEGFQWEALGLLNRLHGRSQLIEEQIKRNCQRKDPDSDVYYRFRFRAGICPLGSQDTAGDAFSRASQSLQKAFSAEKAKGIRVYWYPETDVDQIKEAWKRAIYTSALKNFSDKA